MAVELVMPRLSDAMQEGTIVRWTVPDGVRVQRGQVLAEIASEQATFPYEAPEAGILHVLVPAGARLPLGEPIALIDDLAPIVAGEPAAPAPEHSGAWGPGGPPAGAPPLDDFDDEGETSEFAAVPAPEAEAAAPQVAETIHDDVLPDDLDPPTIPGIHPDEVAAAAPPAAPAAAPAEPVAEPEPIAAAPLPPAESPALPWIDRGLAPSPEATTEPDGTRRYSAAELMTPAALKKQAQTPITPKPTVRLKVSPVARRLAETLSLDLDTIEGTGPEGRIVRSDVEAAAGAAEAAAELERQAIAEAEAERQRQAAEAEAEAQRLAEAEALAEAERQAAAEAEAKRIADAEEAKRVAEEEAEKQRIAEEEAAAEAKRVAEEEAAAAEAKRIADEAAAAEAQRIAEEQAAVEAEAKRIAEEQAAAEAEAKRIAEEEAAAEAKRIAEEEAEQQRLAEEQAAAEEAARVAAEEAAAAEAQRIAEEQAAAEARRIAEEEAAAEAKRIAEAAAAAEEAARVAAEEAAAAEAKRIAEEQAAAEAQRLAEEKAAAEAKRVAEEQAAAEAEAQRIAEEEAAAEAQRVAEAEAAAAAAEEAARVAAEEAAAAEAHRIAEEEAAAEAQRLAEEEAAAEAQRLAEEEAAADARRLADEAAAAEAEHLAAEAQAAETPASEQRTMPAAQPGGGRGESEVVELTRQQQTVARRMAEAKATIPDYSATVEVDGAPILALRADLASTRPDLPAPSVNDLIIKAAAIALRAHPIANGTYKDGKWERYPRVNVGFAVDAGDQLAVPVIHDADQLSVSQIAARTTELAEKARAGELRPPDVSSSTFTISNLGMLGVDLFTAVISPGQAAILTVGRITDRPVVRDGAVVAGKTLYLTLSSDHRVLYGAEAARVLTRIRELLEHPSALLA